MSESIGTFSFSRPVVYGLPRLGSFLFAALVVFSICFFTASPRAAEEKNPEAPKTLIEQAPGIRKSQNTQLATAEKAKRKDPVKPTSATLVESAIQNRSALNSDLRKAYTFVLDFLKPPEQKPAAGARKEKQTAETKPLAKTPSDEPFDNAREVVETMLYAKDGKKKARREGRRLWADPATQRITIVDRPDRIRAVEDYLRSLRTGDRSEKYAVIELKHVDSETMASLLNRILQSQSSRRQTSRR